jgi:hypothetical protein
VTVNERLARLETCQEQTKALVEEIRNHLVGSPGADGLVTRLSKVEGRQGLLMRIAGAIGASLLGVAVWLFKERG